MNKFPDIIEILPVDSYLNQLPIERRVMYDLPFENALTAIRSAIMSYGYTGEEIKVSVSSSKEIDAMGGEGYIRITEGLIEHCLSMNDNQQIFDFLEEMMLENKKLQSKILISQLPASVWLGWTCTHEAIHGLRRHTRASDMLNAMQLLPENTFQYSDFWAQALEFDADLCAIAMIFRRIYSSANCTEDLETDVKRVIAGIMFFGILKLPSYKASGTHQSWPIRFKNMVYKLAHMQAKEDGTIARGNPDVVAMAHIVGEIMTFIREHIIALAPEVKAPARDFYNEMLLDVHATSKVVLAWEEIESVVRESSSGNMNA